MLQRSNVSSSSSYLVPCVFKAVQMIEGLRRTRVGLRVEEFLGMTGYSRSTIYRILRTLIVCEYIRRDAGGYYHLNHAVISVVDENSWTRAIRRSDATRLSEGDRQLEFERWGVRFRGDGSRVEELPQCGAESAAGTHTEA